MANIKFIAHDGTETEIVVDAAEQLSLMQAAVNNGVPGIDAECGGALSCATCHVHFDHDWYDKLPAAAAMERDMLEFVIDPRDTSRLCCQIKVTEQLDGIVVYTPESQY
jgi:2Fe-2S ferredoxin